MRNSMRRLVTSVIARHRPLIEAEATAAERARIRAAVEGLPRQVQYADPFFSDTYDYETVGLAAALAAIEGSKP